MHKVERYTVELFVGAPELHEVVLASDYDALAARIAALEQQRGGVVLPEPDEIHQMAFEEGEPDEGGDGYHFDADEFDLFAQRLMGDVARLNPPGDGVNWKAVAGEQKTIIEGLQARLNPPGECVAVQRELLSRIVKCYEDGMSIYGECEELRTILAQQGKAVGDE